MSILDRISSRAVSRQISGVPDFRRAASQGLALASVVPLVPIAAHNLLHGRVLLACLAAVIAVLLAANVWYLRRTDREAPLAARLGFAALQVGSIHFSIELQGIDGALWAYPAILSFYLYLPERAAWVANVVLLGVTVPAIAGTFEAALVVRFVATTAGVSVLSAILVNVIGRQQALLEHRIVTDPLTGLQNRSALESAIDEAIAKACLDGAPMALLAVDLDHFKRVNDTLGHAAGDEVLRALGRLLKQRSRLADTAFRLGGEEFLVLLRGTPPRRARRIADALREAIAAAALIRDETITASIGVAALVASDDGRSWIRRADEALYRAKAGGRDRVEGPSESVANPAGGTSDEAPSGGDDDPPELSIAA